MKTVCGKIGWIKNDKNKDKDNAHKEVMFSSPNWVIGSNRRNFQF